MIHVAWVGFRFNAIWIASMISFTYLSEIVQFEPIDVAIVVGFLPDSVMT